MVVKVEHARTLVINHLLYLTPEQRRVILEEKTPVQVIGVSVPVWFNDGKSSEPGQEVFCQYTLTNEPQQMMVQTLPTGYRINLPQARNTIDDESELALGESSPPARISPDQRKLGDQYGVGWLLFKQFQKIKHKDGELNVLHYIEMRDIAYYEDSVRQKDSTEETTPSAC